MIQAKKRVFNAMHRLFLCMVILVSASFLSKAYANNDSFRFSEKVNLALRRTAHHLLIQNGDSLSTVPVVKQLDANTFVIQLNQLFEYDKLPELLQQSFDMHHITRPYDVSILDCASGKIQLGYNILDLNQKGGVPCANRTKEAGCYNLKVSFEPQPQTASASGSWWLLPLGSIMTALGFIVWKRSRSTQSTQSKMENDSENNDQKRHFGRSIMDLPNLTLHCGNKIHQLTYREAKLLNLFVSNQNQLLERDYILKAVWEDEGVIVGRSVDVFVSRLRKMLSGDETIKIVAVHGVGYRMEVNGI